MRHLSIYRNVDVVSKVGSIRQAAELLAITPSALNRQILGLEEELGVPIFERLARGVRLSTAGELLIHHIRNQLSDLDRVQSHIADLSGVRRGHVSIACSQALLPYFLPQQIEVYRKEHPGVTFSVSVRDREAAEQALRDYAVDVAIIFEPVHLADCQTLLIAKQTIHAIMSKKHPLARRKTVKLEQCVDYPLALPSLPYGVRALMEQAATKKNLTLDPAIQSDSFEFLRHVVADNENIAFQIEIGLPRHSAAAAVVSRPVSEQDLPAGRLHLTQLRGRSLPVAAARFADQLQTSFTENFECV
ncbi:MAG: LysR family transcriptional regulator [Pseudomonadota bacterium]